MKNLCLGAFAICLLLFSCTPKDLENILNTGKAALSSDEVGLGLKEALRVGIGKGSDLLSKKDGYYKSAYKILLPEEARKVTEKLSIIPGFQDVEEVMVKKLNQAAEQAAIKAKPIFVSAIKQMTIKDAWDILKGNNEAATNYLTNSTRNKLYSEFHPIILQSLNEVNAVKYWGDAVTQYNKIPFVNKANPRLDDYVTNRALDGLFSMVAKEERNIRSNISARTSDLLRRVFAEQD